MDTARVIDNRTPMQADCGVVDDHHGREVLLVLSKLTWAVSPSGHMLLAHRQAPLRMIGEYTDPDKPSSIRYPNDWAQEKPGTDVLLIGTAHPPPGRSVESFDVSLEIAHPTQSRSAANSVHKVVRVFGPRVWIQGAGGQLRPGPCRAAEPTPLVYEMAYGGYDHQGDRFVLDERNPVGNGVALNRSDLLHQPAPRLESPSAPLATSLPIPVGFGAIEAHWSPRSDYFGTGDERWMRERSPVMPVDFDTRFNCCAPPGQWLSQPLSGDEIVRVSGTTPKGAWTFKVPGYAPVFTRRVRGEESPCATHLDTLLIDADKGQIELTWRTSFPIPRKTEFIESVIIYPSGELPSEVLADLITRSRIPSDETAVQ